MNGRIGAGISALLLLALLLVETGCNRYQVAAPPVPQPAQGARAAASNADGPGGPSAEEGRDASRISSSSAAAPEVILSVVADNGAVEAAGAPPADDAAILPPETAAAGGAPAEAKEGPDAFPLPDASPPPAAAQTAAPPSAGTANGPTPPAEATPSAGAPKPAAPPHPAPAIARKDARGASPPEWTKGHEELVYRVDFLGITMGYARFRYQGKVLLAGKPAYHLNVRAWTSGVLSFIYPINDTIDYYLDAETLAPIRQEFTQRAKGKDDVAHFNQETGRITYRYRQTGAIRKQVDTIPPIYDPVSVAYYFRWRDLGVENRPRNVYGGRKVYQISSRVVGNERIRTEHGEVDTIAVVPLIRREGKPDPKGELKIWFSSDERRVPVRLYAKFRKIKEWTLVGELMPPATAKAGG